MLEAFDGAAVPVWPIQPGRDWEEHALRGITGPRAGRFTSELPKGLFE
jgi:hypothetical protein